MASNAAATRDPSQISLAILSASTPRRIAAGARKRDMSEAIALEHANIIAAPTLVEFFQLGLETHDGVMQGNIS